MSLALRRDSQIGEDINGRARAVHLNVEVCEVDVSDVCAAKWK
jgi:hypothetical protein